MLDTDSWASDFFESVNRNHGANLFHSSEGNEAAAATEEHISGRQDHAADGESGVRHSGDERDAGDVSLMARFRRLSSLSSQFRKPPGGDDIEDGVESGLNLNELSSSKLPHDRKTDSTTMCLWAAAAEVIRIFGFYAV